MEIPVGKADCEKRILLVPVRGNGGGSVSLRFGRLDGGGRVAIAFTSEERLYAALGAAHPAIRISGRALRAMAHPLGVDLIQIDPVALAGVPAHPGSLVRAVAA